MRTVGYHIKGIAVTFQQLIKGKYLLFFIPGILITLFYLWIQSYTSDLGESIHLSSEKSWLDWIAGYLNKGVGAAFSAFNFILAQLYIFIVLTALSPFNTFLGEKFDRELTGNVFEGGLIRFINDFIRMIFVVIIALILEFATIGLYWLISKIFGLAAFDSIASWIIAAFFFGFSFYDFALERYEIGVAGSMGFSFKKPLTMVLTGSIFLGIYSIPVIGIPLAPVITLMISTVVYLYIEKKLPRLNNELKEISNEQV